MNMKLTNGLLGLGALLIAGQVNAETVSLTPSVTSVAVNEAFTLTVQGTDFINDVSAGSILVSWDATAMSLTSTLANLAASASANGFPVDFNVNTIVPGQLSATYATLGTVAGPTFNFFSMDFVGISPTSATTLVIETGYYGDWQDGSGVSVTPVTYVGASVEVNAVPAPPPVIDDTATVAPDAEIGDGSTVGANTVINKEVSVGEGSTIGADVTINKETQLGDNTVVGDGSTIHKNVTAGDDLTVGSNVTIHKDVMIGERVTIGDNTVIHSGTMIGSDVLIGVGVFIGNDVIISSGETIADYTAISNNTTVP